MAARLYAPALDSVVALDFTHAGVRYTKGMTFPHKELGLIDVETRGLWLAYMIDFVMPDASTSTPKPKAQRAAR